jgi:hypothetical protein
MEINVWGGIILGKKFNSTKFHHYSNKNFHFFTTVDFVIFL